MEAVINGLKYKINVIDKLSEPDCIGCCTFETQTIEIYNGLSNEQKIKTFIHELTYAFMWCYGYHDVKFNQETVCNFIGYFFEEMNKIVKGFIENEIK